MSCPWCGGAVSEVIRGELLRCNSIGTNGEKCGYQYRPRPERRRAPAPAPSNSPSSVEELQAAAVARRNEATRLENERLEEERRKSERERPYREAARQRVEALNSWAKEMSLRLESTKFPKDHALYYSVSESYRTAWGREDWRERKTIYCMGWVVVESSFNESVDTYGELFYNRAGRQGVLLTTLGNFVCFRMPGEGYELLTRDKISDRAGKASIEEVEWTVETVEKMSDPGSFFVLGGEGGRIFWTPILRLEEALGKLAERANLL